MNFEDEEDDMCSPERKTKTRIEMQETHLKELEHEVKGAIERQRTGKIDSAEKKPKEPEQPEPSQQEASVDPELQKQIKKLRKEFKQVAKSINKNEILELRALASPPAAAKEAVSQALLLAKGLKALPDWAQCTKILREDLKFFTVFDPKSITKGQVKIIKRQDPQAVAKVSLAAQKLVSWTNLALDAKAAESGSIA